MEIARGWFPKLIYEGMQSVVKCDWCKFNIKQILNTPVLVVLLYPVEFFLLRLVRPESHAGKYDFDCDFLCKRKNHAEKLFW